MEKNNSKTNQEIQTFFAKKNKNYKSDSYGYTRLKKQEIAGKQKFLNLVEFKLNMTLTVSAIKADIGGIGVDTRLSDKLVQTVRDFVLKNGKGILIDNYIGYTGDDIHIVMTHTLGTRKQKNS